MAYSRFSSAEVYVFMSTSGHLECCSCWLGDQWSFDSTQEMVDHLAKHREAGHDVPDGLEAELWDDDQENWVTYERCPVDDCEERLTCGSPTADGGYVSACSVKHAQTLGGFADWPVR